MSQKENKLILYKDDEWKLSVNTLFADEDVWLTQAQLVEIYKSSKSNISEHLRNIFKDNELDKEVEVRKFRTTTQQTYWPRCYEERVLPISTYLECWFSVSLELRDLVYNNFKSEEQIRFEKQQLLTRVSIIVAIILGLLGIVF